ncbi:MAG: hypothetical protein ACOY3N_09520 [Bradyrhizobium sp.]|uniref:hypothetical protein n=1 Tax=Bradyrhizobium sp. TaxID=376 RepID=UPI003BEF9281
MTIEGLDEILDSMARCSRNNALEAAAKVAALYGASDEVCIKILQLRDLVPTERTNAQA